MSDQPDLFDPDPEGAPTPRAPTGHHPRPAHGRDVPVPMAARSGLERPAGDAPLSTRMRPTSLDEYVGQRQAIGPGTVLRAALEDDALPSLILWGPPGSGKTTLARIVAAMTQSSFEAVSAVGSGVADLRAAVARADERRRMGRRTVLFIDEIHRFSKSQQDAVLPHVESGVVRLLGATTENPGFEVNVALLSRARVVRLEALDMDDLRTLVERALADSDRGLGGTPAALDAAALQRLLSGAGGDARVVLDALEVAVRATRPDAAGLRRIDAATVEGALQSPLARSDRAGDEHFWLASALIKSIRGSDPDAAVYWTARLLEAGEDPVFVARRLVILAAEDVGLADPQALPLAVAAQQAAHLVGMPEGYLPLTEAALYLALAPKSNSALRAYVAARADVLSTPDAPVPLHLRNATSGPGRRLGFGEGYRYAHDHEQGVVEQQHLPGALTGRRYYEAGRLGVEAELWRRLEERRRSAGPMAEGGRSE